ncbi:MAG TPA: hypothetical protein VFT29_05145 [Gemmatimonadaceae bacterium]|nr:hypothetical protein [Gemmatimonadaceae bacterium]
MNDDLKNHTNDEPDFGPDAGVLPGPADPAFDAWIARVAPSLNEPRATPRLEMWQAIQAARDTARDAEAGRLPGVTPLRRRPWRLMSVIAAALLLGVAIDRVVLREAERPSVTPPVATGPRSDSNDATRLYRIAAAQTLTQAEALLTAYRSDGAPEQNAMDAQQLGRWGREVLSSTRLLMDSPAGDDPQLRALFNDLELVLVQIIQLSGGELDPQNRARERAPIDRALIERALESKDLLPRIRTAVPAGVAGANAASDD